MTFVAMSVYMNSFNVVLSEIRDQADITDKY
jgi:hypothetical protein